MATAKKTPSGKWRCQLYVGKDENGKRIIKSFTADTKREAERMAANYEFDKKTEDEYPTFEEAARTYIEHRRNEMSVNTVREYYRSLDTDLERFKNIRVDRITEEMIQEYIDDHHHLSPKTLFNRVHFILPVLKKALKDRHLTFDLMYDQYVEKEMVIPEIDEVKVLMEKTKGTSMYLPILLAAMCGLRRSEITSISPLKNGYIEVRSSEGLDDSRMWVKQNRTKTVSSTRKIKVPEMIADVLKDTPYPYVKLKPSQITDRFITIKKQLGFDFRFHDLRHFCASFLMTMGYPNKYIIKYLGHGSENMVNRVYYHCFKKESKDMENDVCSTLNSTFST